jgi:hypothetical protein
MASEHLTNRTVVKGVVLPASHHDNDSTRYEIHSIHVKELRTASYVIHMREPITASVTRVGADSFPKQF